MLQYLDKLQQEDMENLIKKREIQRDLMVDVAKANEVSHVVDCGTRICNAINRQQTLEIFK